MPDEKAIKEIDRKFAEVLGLLAAVEIVVKMREMLQPLLDQEEI